jgi:hypothetical protein
MGQVGSDSQSASASDVNCTAPTITAVAEARLSIDSIYLTVDLPAEATERIHEFIADIPKSSKIIPAFPFHTWHSRHYKAGFRAYLNDLLAWEPSKASALVCETGPKRPSAKNTIFRWNPAKCDSLSVAAIVFNDYLNLSPAYLLESTVSGIDLAIDIPGASVDDQAISYPKMQLVENRFSSGRTMYLGALSGRTRIVAYDKKAEIVSSNSKLGTYLAELKEPVPAHDLLRIEMRIRPSPAPLLSDLAGLANPFLKLRVHARPQELTRLEDMALALARHEGLPRAMALAQFTGAERKAFCRKLGKAGSPAWWHPEGIWESQFPSLAAEFLAPFAPPQWYGMNEVISAAGSNQSSDAGLIEANLV